MSKKVRMKWEDDVDALTVTGTDKVTGASITFGYEQVSEANRPKLICFALKTLLATRTSSVDPDDKLDAMQDVVALLGTDAWEKEREGGGLSVVSVFTEAVAAVQGITIPQAQRALKGLSPKARDGIKAHPKVKAEMARIKEERDAADETISLDDLLS